MTEPATEIHSEEHDAKKKRHHHHHHHKKHGSNSKHGSSSSSSSSASAPTVTLVLSKEGEESSTIVRSPTSSRQHDGDESVENDDQPVDSDDGDSLSDSGEHQNDDQEEGSKKSKRGGKQKRKNEKKHTEQSEGDEEDDASAPHDHKPTATFASSSTPSSGKELKRHNTVQHIGKQIHQSPKEESPRDRRLRKRSISGNFSALASVLSGSKKTDSPSKTPTKRSAVEAKKSPRRENKKPLKREASKKSLKKLSMDEFCQEVQGSALRRSSSASNVRAENPASPRRLEPRGKTTPREQFREDDLVFEALRRLREDDKRFKTLSKRLSAAEEREEKALRELKEAQQREKKLRRTMGLGKEGKDVPSGSRQQLKMRVLEMEGEMQEVREQSTGRVEQMGLLLDAADKRAKTASETAKRALEEISASEQKALQAELHADDLAASLEKARSDIDRLKRELEQSQLQYSRLKGSKSTVSDSNSTRLLELEIELAATEAKTKQLSEMAVQAAKRAKVAENKLRTAERTNKIATLTVSLLKTASKGGVELPSSVLSLIQQLEGILEQNNQPRQKSNLPAAASGSLSSSGVASTSGASVTRKPVLEGNYIRVSVFEARGIKWDTVNAYCVCKVNGLSQQTILLNDSVREGRWDESFLFPTSSAAEGSRITLTLMNGAPSSKSKAALGTVTVDLDTLTNALPATDDPDYGHWLDLNANTSSQELATGAAIRVRVDTDLSAAREPRKRSEEPTNTSSRPSALEIMLNRMKGINEPEEDGDDADVIPVDESDMSPLEKAANAYPVANLQEVTRLLEECKREGTSFDHEFENDSEQTYVHLMALQGNPELLEWLISLGCSIKNGDYNSVTALHMASWNGNASCVQLLLNHHCDVDAEDRLAAATALHYAAANGHDSVVQLLLNAGAAVNHPDRNQCTPLMKAAIRGHVNTVRMLLAQNADPLLVDRDEVSAFLYASLAGHMPVVIVLNENGGHTDAPSQTGDSPLWAALLHGNKELASTILSKSSSSTSTSSSASASGKLIDAPLGAHKVTMLQRVILHSQLLNRTGDESEAENCLNALSFLLSKGATVDVRSGDGKTALFYAAVKGFGEVVRALLKAGANANLVDSNGNSALHFAKSRSVAELLIAAAHPSLLTASNSTGNTPLHAAFAFERPELIDLLIASNPASLQITNSNQNLPEECAFAAEKRIMLPFYPEDESSVSGGLYIGRVSIARQ